MAIARNLFFTLRFEVSDWQWEQHSSLLKSVEHCKDDNSDT